MKTITVQELKEHMSAHNDREVLIDVRTPGEYETEHIMGAKNIPLETVEDAAEGLKHYETVFVQCRSGGRSAYACGILEHAGVHAVNVEGGVQAWMDAGFEVAGKT